MCSTVITYWLHIVVITYWLHIILTRYYILISYTTHSNSAASLSLTQILNSRYMLTSYITHSTALTPEVSRKSTCIYGTHIRAYKAYVYQYMYTHEHNRYIRMPYIYVQRHWHLKFLESRHAVTVHSTHTSAPKNSRKFLYIICVLCVLYIYTHTYTHISVYIWHAYKGTDFSHTHIHAYKCLYTARI
jgi:hypothetical protein